MKRTQAGRAALVAALASLLLLPLGATAHAADASGGCTGIVTSYDASGAVIDHARAPGAGGTEADPLNLDPDGAVAWQAGSAKPITSGTYTVGISGATVKSGTIDNPDAKTSVGGDTSVSDLPSYVQPLLKYMLLTDGKLAVTASASDSGSGAECSATLWITGVGDTTGSPAFWMGIGVLILVAVLLLMLVLTTTTTEAAATTAATAAPAPATAGKE